MNRWVEFTDPDRELGTRMSTLDANFDHILASEINFQRIIKRHAFLRLLLSREEIVIIERELSKSSVFKTVDVTRENLHMTLCAELNEVSELNVLSLRYHLLDLCADAVAPQVAMRDDLTQVVYKMVPVYGEEERKTVGDSMLSGFDGGDFIRAFLERKCVYDHRGGMVNPHYLATAELEGEWDPRRVLI